MFQALRRCTAALSLALVCAASAHADIATLTSSKDATLFNDGVGAKANGGNFSFYAGRAGTSSNEPVRRGILAFDTSSIPVGSTVTNVTLRLFMSQTSATSAGTFVLRRVTTNWNEGTTGGQSGNGGTAGVGDVTWVHTYWNNQFWNTPGGDFSPTTSASLSIGGFGYYTFASTSQLVADVQGWVNQPGTSFGWILSGPEQAGQKSARQFEARESLAQYRPLLTVTYTPPPPTVYCTAKVNSLGCTPAIGYSGLPDANAGSGFFITATNVLNNKTGLLFYGVDGPSNFSFQGGFLCVKSPTTRTPPQNAAGNPPPDDCSGAYSIDFNVRIASGVDVRLVAGSNVWSQYWSRDPTATFTTNLSDALTFSIFP